ncbi:MAG TPA: phytanoyl-CoA dioxygenase family protein [Chthonomonadaceae bacterium]|nr:phytanoyl-CoA dioxygenase family protein [Chthonomonadaceae bacterium]
MALTTQQCNFFETFGFLVLPGQLREEIGWITEEFTSIHANHQGPKHDGSKRTCIVPFIDQSARLSTLLDHPKLVETASSLLGEDFNYIGGDGNYYTGDTGWHSDGWHENGLYIKIALYLDPVTRDTGCLRVIPGSHVLGSPWVAQVRRVGRPEEHFGVHGRDIPAIPLESQPGDVVVFNHNLHHASFGGNSARRMFTLNLCRRAQEGAELQELKDYIGSHGRFWIDHLHSDTMRGTASPDRLRHLEQVMANEAHLAEASRRARETLSEPSRG